MTVRGTIYDVLDNIVCIVPECHLGIKSSVNESLGRFCAKFFCIGIFVTRVVVFTTQVLDEQGSGAVYGTGTKGNVESPLVRSACRRQLYRCSDRYKADLGGRRRVYLSTRVSIQEFTTMVYKGVAL